MEVPLWAWGAVIAAILAMLALDLFVLHRRPHEVTMREAAMTSAMWVTLGLGFAGIVAWAWGAGAAGEYVAGYLIEKSLSVDNIFVFALLLGYFAIPPARQHRVLFWGVLGALVLRGIFIAAGSALLENFHWTLYVFGAFLIFTGFKMARHGGTEVHPDRNPVLRFVRRIYPAATPALAALVAVETTDVLFAVDSVPAVFAVTDVPFLVFTSNAFAILGMRALYFLLAGMMTRFVYLKLGLAVVLALVGTKMLLTELLHIPVWASLAAIAVVLATSIATSLRAASVAASPD
jgi:tellurite resistance protein TerC